MGVDAKNMYTLQEIREILKENKSIYAILTTFSDRCWIRMHRNKTDVMTRIDGQKTWVKTSIAGSNMQFPILDIETK